MVELNEKKGIYKMQFWFEWSLKDCLWSRNDAAIEKFDICVDIKELPISQELKDEILSLCKIHVGALNWDDPASGLIWTNEQEEDFLNKAEKTYNKLCSELGPEFDIEFVREV